MLGGGGAGGGNLESSTRVGWEMSMERLVHINTHNGEVCFGCYCMVWHGMACCGMLAPLEDPCRLQMDRKKSHRRPMSHLKPTTGVDLTC